MKVTWLKSVCECECGSVCECVCESVGLDKLGGQSAGQQQHQRDAVSVASRD